MQLLRPVLVDPDAPLVRANPVAKLAAAGALFVALVLLVLACLDRLRWAPWFTLVMLTVGSPGAHFAVRATRTS